MTINGSIPALPSLRPATAPPAPPVTRDVPNSPGSAAPVAPAGTNAELWALLSPDEQAFFAEERVRGPLTYRPGAADGPAQPVARGQRIDVRA